MEIPSAGNYYLANDLKRIWYEVLARAIEEATAHRIHDAGASATPERIRREAVEWLMRDPDFIQLCEWAGLEADYLRRNLDQRLRALKQWREAQRMPEIPRQHDLQAIAAD